MWEHGAKAKPVGRRTEVEFGAHGWRRILMPKQSWGLEKPSLGEEVGGGRGRLGEISVYFELGGTCGDAVKCELSGTSGDTGNAEYRKL